MLPPTNIHNSSQIYTCNKIKFLELVYLCGYLYHFKCPFFGRHFASPSTFFMEFMNQQLCLWYYISENWDTVFERWHTFVPEAKTRVNSMSIQNWTQWLIRSEVGLPWWRWHYCGDPKNHASASEGVINIIYTYRPVVHMKCEWAVRVQRSSLNLAMNSQHLCHMLASRRALSWKRIWVYYRNAEETKQVQFPSNVPLMGIWHNSTTPPYQQFMFTTVIVVIHLAIFPALKWHYHGSSIRAYRATD